MPGICRVNKDIAGGVIAGQIQDGTVYANGYVVSVDEDPVTPHGIFPHSAPVMIANSKNVYINGILVCNEGDLATCGHPASGSTDVFVGDP